MARHGEILDSFKQKADNFDFTNEEHVTCVRISVATPPDVSRITVPIMQDLNIRRPFICRACCDQRRLNGKVYSAVDAVCVLMTYSLRYLVFFGVCVCVCVCFQLKMVLIKCCDISNEVRPTEVAEPWVDCLLEEYFMQVTSTKPLPRP